MNNIIPDVLQKLTKGKMLTFTTPQIFIRKNNIKTNGYAFVYLRIIIGKRKKDINTKIEILASEFDKESRTIKKSHPNASDLNLILKNLEAKCTEIFTRARLLDHNISLESFLKEFQNFESKDDFYALVERNMMEKVKTGIMCQASGNQHRYMLNKLKAMQPTCLIKDVTSDFVERFSYYLRKIGNNDTTRAKALVYLKIYARIAMAENRNMANPFEKFIMPATSRRLVYLDKDELKLLIAYQQESTTPPLHAMALRIFLFMCFTGLRVGDALTVHSNKIFIDVLVMVPEKTKRYGKMISIPLSEQAKRYMNKEAGLLLPALSEQYCNRLYKEIAIKLGIKKNISHHVARHSFATNFLEHGGHIEVLQDLMGHTDIKTTMVYSQVVAERKKLQVVSAFSEF